MEYQCEALDRKKVQCPVFILLCEDNQSYEKVVCKKHKSIKNCVNRTPEERSSFANEVSEDRQRELLKETYICKKRKAEVPENILIDSPKPETLDTKLSSDTSNDSIISTSTDDTNTIDITNDSVPVATAVAVPVTNQKSNKRQKTVSKKTKSCKEHVSEAEMENSVIYKKFKELLDNERRPGTCEEYSKIIARHICVLEKRIDILTERLDNL